jgi:predicted nucleic acid-binding protein
MHERPPRLLLDTNAVITLLRGNEPLRLFLQKAAWVGISVISELEFLSFPRLSQEDRELLAQFAQRCEVVGLSHEDRDLLRTITSIRRERRLRLPDAIVVGTAIHVGAVVVTADEGMLKACPRATIPLPAS